MIREGLCSKLQVCVCVSVSGTALSLWDAALVALSCPCGCRPVKNNFIFRRSKMKHLILILLSHPTFSDTSSSLYSGI